jgi:hypothetical protein
MQHQEEEAMARLGRQRIALSLPRRLASRTKTRRVSNKQALYVKI